MEQITKSDIENVYKTMANSYRFGAHNFPVNDELEDIAQAIRNYWVSSKQDLNEILFDFIKLHPSYNLIEFPFTQGDFVQHVALYSVSEKRWVKVTTPIVLKGYVMEITIFLDKELQ